MMASRQCNAAVIGAGGNIGSQLVPHLARMDEVGNITLVDHDRYEAKNLRGQHIVRGDVGRNKVLVQAKRIKAVDPELHVTALAERVEDVPLGLLRGDFFLLGLDSKLTRMCTSRIAVRLGMPVIDAGIRPDGMLGRVTVCVPTRGTACLECGWGDAQYQHLDRRTPCLDGDPAATPTNAPSELGGLVAAYQGMELRKLLQGGPGSLDTAYQVVIDLRRHSLKVSMLPRNPNCRCDHTPWEIEPVEADPAGTTIEGLLGELGMDSGQGHLSITLHGKTFALALTCPECGARRPMMRFVHRLSDRQRACPKCGPKDGKRMIVVGNDGIDRIDPSVHTHIRGMRLRRLGFRLHDVVTIRSQKRTVHGELFFPKSETERGGNDER